MEGTNRTSSVVVNVNLDDKDNTDNKTGTFKSKKVSISSPNKTIGLTSDDSSKKENQKKNITMPKGRSIEFAKAIAYFEEIFSKQKMPSIKPHIPTTNKSNIIKSTDTGTSTDTQVKTSYQDGNGNTVTHNQSSTEQHIHKNDPIYANVDSDPIYANVDSDPHPPTPPSITTIPNPTQNVSQSSSFKPDKPTGTSSPNQIVTENSKTRNEARMSKAKTLIETKVKLELISSASIMLKSALDGKTTSSDLVIFVSIKGKRIQITPPGDDFMNKSAKEQKEILKGASATLSEEKNNIIHRQMGLKEHTPIKKAIKSVSKLLSEEKDNLAKLNKKFFPDIGGKLTKYETDFRNKDEIIIGKFTFKRNGKTSTTDNEEHHIAKKDKLEIEVNEKAKTAETLADDTKNKSISGISDPTPKDNNPVIALEPYILSFQNASAKQQATSILEKAKALTESNPDLPGVAITYSANHDQTLKIIDTYSNNAWHTGTAGSNQAAVMEQLEDLLTNDYKELQGKFRIAPITTMVGPASPTLEQANLGLNYIKTELMEKGWHVLGWQNQDTKDNTSEPYAIGGGVASRITYKSIQTHIQDTLKNFSNK